MVRKLLFKISRFLARTGFWVGGFFTVILIIISVGSLLTNHTPSGWVKTQGTIVSYSTEEASARSKRWGTENKYKANVEFIVNGIIYKAAGDLSRDIPLIGERYEIAYDPSDPNKSKATQNQNSVTIAMWVLLGIGVMTLLILIFVYKYLKHLNYFGAKSPSEVKSSWQRSP